MTLEIVPPAEADYDELLALNESCVPHVNSIGIDEIAFFHRSAHKFIKVVENGELAGFVIALVPGINYESLNYQWFSRELSGFLYIDRILVHPNFRRRGVASFLYDYLEQVAVEDSIDCLCCEVNLLPVNPESLALHEQLGFSQKATQLTENGTKEVSMLVKPLIVEQSV
jgi:uncharacterized protein